MMIQHHSLNINNECQVNEVFIHCTRSYVATPIPEHLPRMTCSYIQWTSCNYCVYNVMYVCCTVGTDHLCTSLLSAILFALGVCIH